MFGHVNRDDLPRIRSGEGDAFLARTDIRKMRHKDRFTRQNAFARAQQLAHNPLVRVRSIAHFGLEGDPIMHIIHRSGLGNDRLTRIQLDFNNLHIIPENLIIDFMALHSLPFPFILISVLHIQSVLFRIQHLMFIERTIKPQFAATATKVRIPDVFKTKGPYQIVITERFVRTYFNSLNQPICSNFGPTSWQ